MFTYLLISTPNAALEALFLIGLEMQKNQYQGSNRVAGWPPGAVKLSAFIDSVLRHALDARRREQSIMAEAE